GSLIRPEATGYGAVYFGAAMLGVDRDDYQGKRCLVSGSGNVAQYTIEKLIALGATVVSASDSGGFIYDADGIDRKKLEWIQELKNVRRGRIAEYVNAFPKATYTATKAGADHNPLWANEADCAFPCATQNEINGTDAANLIGGGVKIVVEGANMPTTPAGIDAFADAGVKYAPGKASNAGGVAVSALEMSQNSLRLSWSREEVDEKLQNIMRSIHDRAREAAESYGFAGNYMHGANIAGFRKVADAMMDQGLV
ncbi:MAG: glutamate dehydrogenase, partial [Phycisphaerales bacterium]|nr:glutamate dehydrogenase [Phycisphaerales bacterium]